MEALNAARQTAQVSPHTSDALDHFAMSLAIAGRLRQAAQLLGAAAAMREEVGVQLPPQGRAMYEENLTRIRDGLGEEAFRTAWAEGYAWPVEEAVELALGEAEARAPSSAPDTVIGSQTPLATAGPAASTRSSNTPETLPGRLTAREQEVAVLIAQGLNRRQIAEQFVLSPRTVDTHTANILSKLGFSGRAQIGAWIAAQGLLLPNESGER
jgi:DNA-binding CsgD family transcriptional regulator